MAISNHPHPNAKTQRLIGWLAGLGLMGTVLGSIGLLILGFGYGLGLMVLMVPFLLGLSTPLFLITSLHPAITVEENGLRLKPLVFPASFVRWEAIQQITKHTLLKPPPPSKLHRLTPHEGDMLLVLPNTLPWHYRMVGWMAGHGFTPVFAISNRTHVDYERLRDTVKKHLTPDASH